MRFGGLSNTKENSYAALILEIKINGRQISHTYRCDFLGYRIWKEATGFLAVHFVVRPSINKAVSDIITFEKKIIHKIKNNELIKLLWPTSPAPTTRNRARLLCHVGHQYCTKLVPYLPTYFQFSRKFQTQILVQYLLPPATSILRFSSRAPKGYFPSPRDYCKTHNH